MTVDPPSKAHSDQCSALHEPWSEAGDEPSLIELLADPVMHLIMGRDGLVRADVERAIARGRSALRRRLCAGSLCCAA